MSHFNDLTEYEYLRCSSSKPLNVGWLDRRHEFPTGRVDNELIDLLLEYYSHRQNRTRGKFRCNICRGRNRKTSDRVPADVGSAEIWVTSESGEIFACPDMIIHYIIDHDYLPPEKFLEALRLGPGTRADEYPH